MNIYCKKKNLLISIFLFFLCFTSADLSLATQTEKNTTGGGSYFYYTIKKGDTLWDLSRKFYNSNWVWPGLWGINGQIKNPHLIYPGKKIKIFLRETMELKHLNTGVKKTKTIVKHEIRPTFFYPEMDGLGFIKKKSVRPMGRIIKSRNNNIMMAQNDIIYIEPLGDETMIPGEKYTIFSIETISEKYNKKKFHGVKHSIKGIIKILANKGEYLTAKIIKSFKYASKGNLIMNYKKRKRNIKIIKAIKNINARLICSEDNHNLISSHTIAFINMGSNDRVKPGQMYNIFQKQTYKQSFGSKRKIVLDPLEIGSLIVLCTERTASTVMILSAEKAVRPGYFVN